LWTGSRDPGSITSRSCGQAPGDGQIRIIFVFDPARSALLLLGGDKAGNWERWYRDNVPVAERLYLDYTAEGEQ
jgi:hypothetical protein